MKLFVIYIGGSHEKSLIELHDIRFVVADTIEQTYDELRRSWWGIPKSLHLDAYGELRYADGYKVSLSANKQEQPSQQRLYFLNLGGYSRTEFTELHKNVFVVAENEEQAKQKAKMQIAHWESPHKDACYELESIIDISQMTAQKNVYLVLEPAELAHAFEFTCRYLSIGR